MTGAEFETQVCKWFKSHGYWALNIPKNKYGAQPFDVLAIKGGEIWAVDCKVCGEKRLPLDRIEDNQWLAFESMTKLTNARCGFMCWHGGKMNFVEFEDVVAIRKTGRASIKLED